jgi:hypothetical protein
MANSIPISEVTVKKIKDVNGIPIIIWSISSVMGESTGHLHLKSEKLDQIILGLFVITKFILTSTLN